MHIGQKSKEKVQASGFSITIIKYILIIRFGLLPQKLIRIIPTPLKDLELFTIIWGTHVSDSQIKHESQGFNCENMVPSIGLK